MRNTLTIKVSGVQGRRDDQKTKMGGDGSGHIRFKVRQLRHLCIYVIRKSHPGGGGGRRARRSVKTSPISQCEFTIGIKNSVRHFVLVHFNDP